MPVDIVQWRGEIGTFNNRIKIYFYKWLFCLLGALIYAFFWPLLQIFSMVRFTVNLIRFAISSKLFLFALTRIFRKVRLKLITLLYSVMIVNVMLWYFFRLLELSGDIEFSPGPKPDSSQSFSICHWNLNGMLVHNYSKISLLTAYISIHDFDIICLSETYLTSSADINMRIWKYQGTSSIALIILLMLKEVEFVSIIKLCCL